ncbi:MAG: hypothetical protein ACK5R5_05985 [Alphaproteobacteria bacterium]|jgi:hypothetical protein
MSDIREMTHAEYMRWLVSILPTLPTETAKEMTRRAKQMERGEKMGQKASDYLARVFAPSQERQAKAWNMLMDAVEDLAGGERVPAE